MVRDKEDILQELHNYYEEVYSESNTDDINRDTNMFLNDNHETLTEFEQSLCEGLVTESECLKALKSMKNNKTPGIDGFSAEIYKFFWADIKEVVLASPNYSLLKNELSVDQRRGIITVIPKKDFS